MTRDLGCSPRRSRLGIRDGGTALDFSEARAAFERSWRTIEPYHRGGSGGTPRRTRSYGMEIQNVGDGLQVADPGGKRSIAVLRRCDRQQSVGPHIDAEHMT
jgi:hypothetical protein